LWSIVPATTILPRGRTNVPAQLLEIPPVNVQTISPCPIGLGVMRLLKSNRRVTSTSPAVSPRRPRSIRTRRTSLAVTRITAGPVNAYALGQLPSARRAIPTSADRAPALHNIPSPLHHAAARSCCSEVMAATSNSTVVARSRPARRWLLASGRSVTDDVRLVGFKDVPHPADERYWRERLADQGDTLVEYAVMSERLVRVAGHVQRPHRWAAPCQRLAELPPAHLGHDNVG